MTPKKNVSADLEGKRSLFFLFGIALTLVMAIVVLQYEKSFIRPIVDGSVPIADISEQIDRTVWEVKKPEAATQKIEKVNQNLMPEILENDVDDPTLKISQLFKDPFDDEGLREVGIDDFDDDEVEILDFVAIENIARPLECENVGSRQEQKDCFSRWIQTYVNSNTVYPQIAVEMGLTDKVFVTFIISENGDVEEVTVGRGEYEVLNNEAVRVLKGMPKMTPGSQRGRNVKMRMTVPVNFQLPGR